jgi:methionyl-tRNA formyltransferase
MPSETPLNIVFAGTPAFAAAHLQALLASQHRVVAVYTQPDRPAGRGKQLQASPVKALALEAGIPVFQPVNFKSAEDQATLAALAPDLMVVVAYGLLLPQAVLDSPRLGCINVHASVLPRWRGAAPIQRAVESGDAETGITIMQMEAGLDTGPMLHITRCPIVPLETAGQLHDRLAALGPPALLQVLSGLGEGSCVAQPQDDSQACYARKLSKDEAQLDFSQSAAVLARRVAAFNPVPMAYFFAGEVRVRVMSAKPLDVNTSSAPGEILRLDAQGLLIACGNEALLVDVLQLPGKTPQRVADVLHGQHPFAQGQVLAP